MGITGIQPISISAISKDEGDASGKPVKAGELGESFSSLLSNALQSVENQEKDVRILNDQFIKGQISDVHSLIIASEKAQLGLQLTVQVRNKVIEAYQEIMRTQL